MATIPVTAISTRHFIGATAAKKWALDHAGKDETLFLGTILCRVSGATLKLSGFTNPDGSPMHNTVLTGLMKATVAVGGKGAAPGDEVEATAIFLPGPTASLVAAELAELEKNGEKNPEALLALELHLAAKNDGSMLYVTKSLIARKTDPFASIAKLAAERGLPQIPAPVPAADIISRGSQVIEAEPENLSISDEAKALGTQEGLDKAAEEVANEQAESVTPKGRNPARK